MPEVTIVFTAGRSARANRHWTDEECASWLLLNMEECERYQARWRRCLQGLTLLVALLGLAVLGMAW